MEAIRNNNFLPISHEEKGCGDFNGSWGRGGRRKRSEEFRHSCGARSEKERREEAWQISPFGIEREKEFHWRKEKSAFLRCKCESGGSIG